jgi:ferredoxin-NADP reductase
VTVAVTTSVVLESSDSARPSSPDLDTEMVVASRRFEADGVIGLDLTAPSEHALPAWTPGAHIDVDLPGGLTRQYSLCGDPESRDRWRIAVLREPDGRGGSRWLADELRTGDSLRVRGPRNNFPLRRAEKYVFVAGGIGITPLLPMVRAVEAWRGDWVLHYGGRHRGSMAFLEDLAAYGSRVHVHPQDEVGLLDLESVVGTPSDGTKVYCCGPPPLIEAVEAWCRDLEPGTLHVERFSPVATTSAGPDTAFEVTCARSGVSVTVTPGRTVLQALHDAGVEVLSSCTEGICGTCETDVLDGEPDHRDSLLTEEEQAAGDTMMVCVSRSRGHRLVLDV